jgi:hypothetical protein
LTLSLHSTRTLRRTLMPWPIVRTVRITRTRLQRHATVFSESATEVSSVPEPSARYNGDSLIHRTGFHSDIDEPRRERPQQIPERPGSQTQSGVLEAYHTSLNGNGPALSRRFVTRQLGKPPDGWL